MCVYLFIRVLHFWIAWCICFWYISVRSLFSIFMWFSFIKLLTFSFSLFCQLLPWSLICPRLLVRGHCFPLFLLFCWRYIVAVYGRCYVCLISVCVWFLLLPGIEKCFVIWGLIGYGYFRIYYCYYYSVEHKVHVLVFCTLLNWKMHGETVKYVTKV